MAISTTRITVKIRKELKDEFLAFTRKFKISKDHFLQCQLPKELEHLSRLPTNQPLGREINQMLGGGTGRLNITLTTDLAQEMDRLCAEKGLHREIFLTYYLDFLVNGDEEFGVKSPLIRLEELLENPRLDYSLKKHGNPYRHLYWEDKAAKEFIKDYQTEIKQARAKGAKS